MFTQPCYIRKNNKSLRDKLEEIGYEEYPYTNNDEYPYLSASVYDDGWFNGIEWIHTGEIPNYEGIDEDDIDCENYGLDCGNNEELFLAIAALRDDIDIFQYFVLQYGSIQKCECNSIVDMWGDFDESIGEQYPRKATVKELIEHFK